jgi:DnaK suppressor protein
MTEQEKTELKATMEKKIKQTENAIQDYKEITKPVASDVAIGRLSRMDAINNKSVMEAALREAEAKLQRLQGALGRLDDSDFGLCSKCKQPIPFNRLKAMPDAYTCMNCAK